MNLTFLCMSHYTLKVIYLKDKIMYDNLTLTRESQESKTGWGVW